VGAAIHIAVADAVLQRNAPAPTGGARIGLRVGRPRDGPFSHYRDRAIAGQHIGPIDIAGLERTFDQHAAKPAAVDVQVRLQAGRVAEDDLIDEPILAQGGLRDGALEAHNAQTLGIIAQILGYQSRIEVQRVTQAGDGSLHRGIRKAELARIPERRAQTKIVEPHREAGRLRLVPGVKEGPQIDHAAEAAERMPVGMPGTRPVGELDAEFVRRLRVLDEIAFVDIEKPQQVHQRRDGRLADSYRADLGRLDDGNRASGSRQGSRQYAGCHPARGAAADDGDTFYLGVIRHEDQGTVTSRDATVPEPFTAYP
jgi:hypothetical protein